MKRQRSVAAGQDAKAAQSSRRSPRRAAARSHKRRYVLGALAAVALLLAALISYHFRAADFPAEVLLADARKALAAKNYSAAEDFCLQIISRHGPLPAALLVAGESATKQGRLTEALGYYAQLPTDAGDRESAIGFAAAGDILLHTYHASAAEAQYRRALKIDPQLLFAHDHLGYLLGIEGRRWESLPHLFELLRAERPSIESLRLLGDHGTTIDQTEELEKFCQTAPDDPLPLLGKARLAIRRTQMVEAKRLLKEILVKAPNQIEAQAELGKLLLSESDPELGQWLLEAAPAAEEHPDVWMTRGLWAKQRGDTPGAARCFWEAIRRDPSHQAATYQLAQALDLMGDSEAARRLSDRAVLLEKLCSVAKALFHTPNDLELLRSAAELAEAVGCVWEASGWHQVILGVDPQSAASLAALQRLRAKLREGAPIVLDALNPVKQIDLSDVALPRWDAESLGVHSSSSPGPASYQTRFAETAAAAGIDFRFFAGKEGDEDRGRMFQFTGGGVAVLDYDGDGWPDLYLTQGCRWPYAAGQTEYLDRLYRNRGDGSFEDVTERARLTEDGFSQGAAAGDFNNDGFADLYVANIGVNRLFLNQGDGTFLDVTRTAGIAGDAWTTSCLLADLNGDRLPDIYDVNYVQGADVYERVCTRDGKPRACLPTIFEPQPDRFYMNLGDGRFEERTAAAGMDVGGGNGLGVVAGDFDDSGRLSLFVANDQDANFYFSPGTDEPGAEPEFIERGVLAGLAYDAQGKAQACMGVAAGDADGDGKLDLFVTNFYEEANTLYLQDSSGIFFDADANGLKGPSYSMVGFGAQFIDGDLDGWPDLVVTNGHVDDFTHQQIPYQMPPQYFRGLGGGKFSELPPAELGEFFQGKYLGRGLARLDWNRDGREDFVVSHLDAPTALVSNASTKTGHFLAVQLKGVRSARDAIGARVTLVAGGRSRTGWLTAGDGYQASNQRQLVFGLGPHARVEKLLIRWPSGSLQEFADLAADQELIFVEGSPRVTRLPRARQAKPIAD